MSDRNGREHWFRSILICPTEQLASNSSHVSLKRRVNIPFLTSRKESFGKSLRARSGEIYAEVEQRSRRSYAFAPRVEK